VDTLDLLLHPIRLRIVHAMSGGRTRTTSDLCAHLAEVPKTTVYRHVGLLAEAGVLEVADERRVHGAVERHYRLRGERTLVDAATMTLDDHRHGFAAGMAALLAEFNAYLDSEGADPPADLVGYRQSTFWLDRAELTEMIDDLREVFVARMANRPAPGRTPHLMSAIFFPTDPGNASGPPEGGPEA